MRSLLRLIAIVILATCLQGFLALPLLYDHPSLELIYGRDLTIIVGFVVLLAHTRFRKIAVWLGTISWFSILVFELIRSIGVAAMGQDPSRVREVTQWVVDVAGKAPVWSKMELCEQMYGLRTDLWKNRYLIRVHCTNPGYVGKNKHVFFFRGE